jgi:hypothetical protein
MQVRGGVLEALSVAVEEVLDSRNEHPAGVKVSDWARSAPAEPVTACGNGSAGLMAACSAMLRDAPRMRRMITEALPHPSFVVSQRASARAARGGVPGIRPASGRCTTVILKPGAV